MKIRLRDRLRYHFDNFISSGPKSVFLTLLILFLTSYILTFIIRLAFDFALGHIENESHILTDLWLSFLQITDPGAIAEDGENSPLMKVVGMLTIFLGLIFFSMVIAFITTQLEEKLEDLKKGRSRVIESNHVLILGWGEMVIGIVHELIEANASQKDASIVILSETPREEMEDHLSEHIPERKTTRLITRTGQVTSLESLHRVAVTEARTVIVLPECSETAPEADKMISDARVMKAVLAVVAASREDETHAQIVAEIFDQTKRKVMINLAPNNITMVNTRDIVARIIVQTSRTSGLANVYSDIIGFHGSEIYFVPSPEAGVPFGELGLHYQDGLPIGYSRNAEIVMNPAADMLTAADDEIIMIAEDDSSIRFNKDKLYSAIDLPLHDAKRAQKIEQELIIGWNAKAPIIISEYANYILPGSKIDILLPDEVEGNPTAEIENLRKTNPGIELNELHGNSLREADLRRINPGNYDNVILLNQVEEDTEKLDSASITTLLLIREIIAETENKPGDTPTQIISEVMNSRNLELISRTGVNDSIISNQMIARIISQVAENPRILDVYDCLFSEDGAEIYLKPLSIYLKDMPAKTRMVDLMALACKRGEIMIGYRHFNLLDDVDGNFGIRVNPDPAASVAPDPNDCLIVLAEDEH